MAKDKGKKSKKGKKGDKTLYLDGGAQIKKGDYGKYIMIQIDPKQLADLAKKNKDDVVRTWTDREKNKHDSVTLFAYEKKDSDHFLTHYLVLAPKPKGKGKNKEKSSKSRRR